MRDYLDGFSGPVSDVHQAAEVLGGLSQRLLEAGDPRAAFADVYGIITRAVAVEVQRRDGLFLEPGWIARLAGRFCTRYLETHRWSDRREAQDCGAWRVTYACCEDDHVWPSQRVMLGLSAHINFDLAFGIHATLLEFGCEDVPWKISRLHHDHDQVNVLLRAVFAEAMERVAGPHGCPVGALFHGWSTQLLCDVVMPVIERWRTRVWRDATSLLGASGARRAAIERDIEVRALRIAEVLALPRQAARRPGAPRVRRVAALRGFGRGASGARAAPRAQPAKGGRPATSLRAGGR